MNMNHLGSVAAVDRSSLMHLTYLTKEGGFEKENKLEEKMGLFFDRASPKVFRKLIL
jgi:hypothetical protein